MDISAWLAIMGVVATLVGTITSIFSGLFLVRSLRRKENSVAASNEATARNLDIKSGVELSDASLRVIASLRDEIERMDGLILGMRSEITEAQNKIKAIQVEKDSLRSENEALKLRVYNLETENAQLKVEIENLKNGGSSK